MTQRREAQYVLSGVLSVSISPELVPTLGAIPSPLPPSLRTFKAFFSGNTSSPYTFLISPPFTLTFLPLVFSTFIPTRLSTLDFIFNLPSFLTLSLHSRCNFPVSPSCPANSSFAVLPAWSSLAPSPFLQVGSSIHIQ